MTKIATLPDLCGQDFLNLYRCESNARGKIRLLALHHLQQGEQIQEVSKIYASRAKQYIVGYPGIKTLVLVDYQLSLKAEVVKREFSYQKQRFSPVLRSYKKIELVEEL